MKTENEQKQILEELEDNRGTTQYHKIPFSKIVYTDGINDLIEKCKCWWLISDMGIAISQDEKLQKPFLILEIEVREDNTAKVILKEDSDEIPIYEKELTYTDFPLNKFEFYIINDVMLLTSEY